MTITTAASAGFGHNISTVNNAEKANNSFFILQSFKREARRLVTENMLAFGRRVSDGLLAVANM